MTVPSHVLDIGSYLSLLWMSPEVESNFFKACRPTDTSFQGRRQLIPLALPCRPYSLTVVLLCSQYRQYNIFELLGKVGNVMRVWRGDHHSKVMLVSQSWSLRSLDKRSFKPYPLQTTKTYFEERILTVPRKEKGVVLGYGGSAEFLTNTIALIGLRSIPLCRQRYGVFWYQYEFRISDAVKGHEILSTIFMYKGPAQHLSCSVMGVEVIQLTDYTTPVRSLKRSQSTGTSWCRGACGTQELAGTSILFRNFPSGW